MAHPLTTFPDSQLAIIELLRAQLDASVTVSARVPGTQSLDASSLPLVVVRLDAAELKYPVLETVTIRVSVWHSSELDALALAQAARAELLSYGGGSKVRAILPGSGPIPTTDPESGDSVAFFTVSAYMRPI